MKVITTPSKPFPNYKWRWAVLTPTESLNKPPIFLGVLRVFYKFQNYAPSSKEIMDALEIVQRETNSNVNLVRNQDRNLIRNSGQYWKALGLLEESHGKIIISPFGKLLSEGTISQVEFATTVIKTLELPNKNILSDITEWEKIGLKIKPLELILNILISLSKHSSLDNAYLTPEELVKIVIPLAGMKSEINIYSDAILQFRANQIDISTWPNCANNSNDKRMAREFLLFLNYYGFCKKIVIDSKNNHEKYFLSNISISEIDDLKKIKTKNISLENVAKLIKQTQIPEFIERKKILREVIERPYQRLFRNNVLSAYNSKCMVTGVTIENVLEASHIKPVSEEGNDKIENGLCLRSDIHQLFDSGHLKIKSNGELILSELSNRKENYYGLPNKIIIPNFVSQDFLDWRIKYL